MPPKTLPDAATRLWSKRSDTDCTIACLAMLLNLHPNEVLVAASRINRRVLIDGLNRTHLARLATKLGARVAWFNTVSLDTDDGLLWVQYNDSPRRHVVYLLDGRIYDPDYDPVAMWAAGDYLTYANAARGDLKILKEIE